MRRFPLRLAADLALTRAARASGLGGAQPPTAFIDPAELLHQGAVHPVSHEKIQALVSSRACILWIRGSEPLDHPGIAHLVRAISNSRRFIFLETSAVALRRRIHEFQPLPNFFLLVRLDAAPSGHARTPLEPDPQTLALEGIRAAQLSGFFVAAHTVLRSETGAAGLGSLASLVENLGLDGWIITAGAGGQALGRRAKDARALISSAGWRRFSARVEPQLLARSVSAESLQAVAQPAQVAAACEESVKVS
jgi:hypothetical protein